MAKTGAQYIAESKERKAEYAKIREYLLSVINNEKASTGNKLFAINELYRLDKDGIPMPKTY